MTKKEIDYLKSNMDRLDKMIKAAEEFKAEKGINIVKALSWDREIEKYNIQKDTLKWVLENVKDKK